ncbi:MAG TPA: hypothetical protein VFT50_06585 [Baekduia sp.]|nr:hypothetical protein [Baekduia sp.]
MTWGFIWLMLVLKLPIAALLWIVWWAVHQETDPQADGDDEDGGTKVDADDRGTPRRPRPPFPRRRGPHGGPTVPSPPRVRTTTTVARSEHELPD